MKKLFAVMMAAALILMFCTVHDARAQTTVPLAINQTQARALTNGYWCGYINIYEYATGFDASGLPTALVYGYTQCSSSGRGGHTVKYQGWATVTWDLGGNLVGMSLVPVPNPLPDANAAFNNGGYYEYTQTGTFELVNGCPYVRDTAILIIP